MNCRLNWITQPRPTAFHAAAAIHAGFSLTDPALATALTASTMTLGELTKQAGLSATSLWRHLIPLSARGDSVAELSEAVVQQLISGADRATALSSRMEPPLRAIDETCRAAMPNLREELRLRVGPLRQQWEARGPGLLHRIQKITALPLGSAPVDVLLLHPLLGGHGVAHPPYRAVRFEAVLANPYPQLPEIVRLAWLLAQLHHNATPTDDTSRGSRFEVVAALATVPLVLNAAEQVELCPFNSASLATAVRAWRLGGLRAELAAGIAGEWWEAFQHSRPAWPEALATLDQMLAPLLQE